MTVHELTREQLTELKQNYAMWRDNGLSYYELANIDETVSDERMFEEYADVDFSRDDFSCSAGGPKDFVRYELIKFAQSDMDADMNMLLELAIQGKNMDIFKYLLEWEGDECCSIDNIEVTRPRIANYDDVLYETDEYLLLYNASIGGVFALYRKRHINLLKFIRTHLELYISNRPPYHFRKHYEPLYANCTIRYSSDTPEETSEVVIKLVDANEEEENGGGEDERIFYYCTGVSDFLSLVDGGPGTDFTVVNFESFE